MSEKTRTMDWHNGSFRSGLPSQTMDETGPGGLWSCRKTAQYLGICERSLWDITSPRGVLPAVRIGRAVRYDPADIAAFVEAAKNEGGGK